MCTVRICEKRFFDLLSLRYLIDIWNVECKSRGLVAVTNCPTNANINSELSINQTFSSVNVTLMLIKLEVKRFIPKEIL